MLRCLKIWLIVFMSTGADCHVYSLSSSHATFQVNTRKKTFSLNRRNVSDEVDMGLTIPPEVDAHPCLEGDLCLEFEDLARLVVSTDRHCQTVHWTVTVRTASGTETKTELTELKDCVMLRGHWYGGGEQFEQPWPIEQVARPETAFITADMLQDKEHWYGGVTERYWLSSTGLALLVADDTPLFVSLLDTDADDTADELCLSARQQLPYKAADDTKLQLTYTLCTADDIRQVHEASFPLFYDLPSALPDRRMLTDPVWCTWAEHHADISQDTVMGMATDILLRQYPYSQIEIDDDWESCYGAAEFNTTRFPNATAMVESLHNMNYRVTLWIHPFINRDCQAFAYPDQHGYFVKNSDGKTALTSWWQGAVAGLLDFTNAVAVEWWQGRLWQLKRDTGVDSFKFDAGEASWLPNDYVLHGDSNLWPNIYTTKFIEAVSVFGGPMEVRTGSHTQQHAVLVRMLDKDSNWGHNNGLSTLIPTLLHFGIVGYPFVLPDMVGGNAYEGRPSGELLMRWAQATALMPSMQFSLLPWRFSQQVDEAALAMSQLHQQHAPLMLQLAEQTRLSPSPICRPTWWLCPTDEACLTADQQFLLGDDILSAPITEEGCTNKTVVLPPGVWRSNINNNTLYHGSPTTVTVTDVPVNVLLFFTRLHD